MRLLTAIFCIVLTFVSLSQGHEEWIKKIQTVEDAHTYASKHKDVLVSFVNPEKDRFLFDGVDTSNMQLHVGQSSTLFGRTTKFIKDTMISMVDIQLIEFNTSGSSSETVDVLKDQILKRLRDGDTFWSLKKKYAHTSTIFWSGPELTEDVKSRYKVDLSDGEVGAIYEFSDGSREGIVILNVAAHYVPAFLAISYNSVN